MTLEIFAIIAIAYVTGTVSPAVGRKLKSLFSKVVGDVETDAKSDISVVVKKL
jgi:Flp pilus assembly pilin Flp